VRFGDGGKEGESIFKSFLKPLEALGWGVHAKNLYNDYVYFWRWALWKVFENKYLSVNNSDFSPADYGCC
jgi:hypothetical protein